MRPRFVSAVLIAAFMILPTFGQETRHNLFPQIVVGAGWSCDFVVTNQGILPVNGLQLAFYSSNGNPLVVQSTDQGSNSTFSFNLPAGGSYILKVNAAQFGFGYADLVGPRWATVVATATIRYQVGDSVATQLGVPQQFPFEHYSFAGRVANNVNTGVAIANATLGATAPAAQDFAISLINKDGTIHRSTVIRLEPGQHTSRYLRDVPANNPLFSDVTDWEGVVVVSAQRPFGLLALRQESASLALGTVAINEGPILNTFLVNATATAETEINDQLTSAQAVTLPILISGSIANSADQDYYRFTANAGDVIVAMIETQTIDSELDSELWLLDSAGNEVTMNDQNGVYPQDDSAIRMVIPATGTYYLFVWDFREVLPSSTVGFGYRLHAKVVPANQLF